MSVISYLLLISPLKYGKNGYWNIRFIIPRNSVIALLKFTWHCGQRRGLDPVTNAKSVSSIQGEGSGEITEGGRINISEI